MSRADWSFLEHLLEEGQEYSTAVGRVWLTVLFLFRMLVLGTAAESAWDDEQADFVCNTRQPGCPAVCYDRAFPISHFRYFVLQVIFVSTPTIFYFGYVAVISAKAKRKEEDEKRDNDGVVMQRDDGEVNKENEEGKEKEKGSEKDKKSYKPPPEVPKLKGRLLGAYAFSIFLKVVLEVGFIVGLWFLYGGFFIAAKFECTGFPCPHTVDCFVSRPTEKTIFTVYTQVIAVVSLLLNLAELLHLLQLAISHRLEKRYRAEQQDYLPRVKAAPAQEENLELQSDAACTYQEVGHMNPPVQGDVPRYPNPCESYGDVAIEVNDLLPTYVNYMGAMRTTHSPRIHYKKHARHAGKNTKTPHKSHSKQKHYV
ncbi:gap junction alpha-4 protein [Salarias fasciatus]|uniref:Gap junction protein n=1 Tax=Salarias fasciatus TaxID=181472 RepID=A0A672FA22_SALFA|nr:gap junction alpha-4 protein-like [Salarias fasciatus]XP_029938015.1 gap junction alpha-4 protein-like [Salarias fasciatus]